MGDSGEPAVLQGLRISFPQVRSFVTLASTGNFTRAAEALRLSQPALTTRIRQLEDALELQLFERTPRSVVLTEAGRELLPAFLRLVNDLESAVVSAKDHVRAADVTIRLACLPSCAATLLPDAIRSFKVARPEAIFILEDALNDQVQELVRQGKVDFGVCAAPEIEDPDLASEPLAEDQLQAVFPANHPLKDSQSLTAAELATQPLIITQKASSLRARLEIAFAAHGLTVTPAYEVNYMSSALALVRAGLGVAVLPSSAPETAASDVRTRGLNDPAFVRRLVILRRRSVPLRRVAEAFAEELRRAAEA